MSETHQTIYEEWRAFRTRHYRDNYPGKDALGVREEFYNHLEATGRLPELARIAMQGGAHTSQVFTTMYRLAHGLATCDILGDDAVSPMMVEQERELVAGVIANLRAGLTAAEQVEQALTARLAALTAGSEI
jgi:hypothetical protein